MLPDQETGRIRPFSRPEKVWICLPVVVLILLLPTTMLSYTFLSSEIIDGPQGRYYLPLLVPLLLLCGYNLRKKIVLKSDETALLLGGTSALHLISVYYLALVFLRA